MRTSLFLVIICCGISLGNAQERTIIELPNIPGYQTLMCDFHMHTVFSDGLVWPSVRVDEAWKEGLDAIAITDHLEYLPHDADIRTNHNRAWQIAASYAKGKDVLVIPGTEITKSMPPGHFNALFISDASKIAHENYLESIRAAAEQDAFIIWNHPGWKAQQPDTMKWWDEHTELLRLGYLHGIEVANEREFYPLAINWANHYKLTMLGNSDQHAPFMEVSSFPENHRTCTFVFATEKSVEGIKEALFNQRSAAYIGKYILGEKSLLGPFFLESLKMSLIDTKPLKYSLINSTDLDFEIVVQDGKAMGWSRKLQMDAKKEIVFALPASISIKDLRIEVSNILVAEKETLVLPFTSLLAVEK